MTTPIRQAQGKQKITPHFWFDTQAKEAAALYTSLFPQSSVTSTSTITGTPSGDCDIVTFDLAGQECMAISAGPYFKINPAISLFTIFDTEADIEKTWNALIDGGKALMEYQAYPWADKYGWLQDRYGLSWQLSWRKDGGAPFDAAQGKQRITPLLMFTQKISGKTKEAIEMYASIFPDSSTDMLVPYEKGEGDTEGFIKHSRFTLDGYGLMAMDSSGPHEFVFNEGISLIVNCDSQEEIDYYWGKLSAVPESEQCGWLKDKYGVSWQIVPKAMNEMMAKGTPEQIDRVTQAFLKMKKFDIATLQKAYDRK